LVTSASPFGGEVVLVPPLELRLRRQGCPVRLLAADQISAYRDHRPAAMRPQRSDDIRRSGAPIEPGDDRVIDSQRVHERDAVAGERRLLTVPHRAAETKTGCAIAP